MSSYVEKYQNSRKSNMADFVPLTTVSHLTSLHSTQIEKNILDLLEKFQTQRIIPPDELKTLVQSNFSGDYSKLYRSEPKQRDLSKTPDYQTSYNHQACEVNVGLINAMVQLNQLGDIKRESLDFMICGGIASENFIRR